ncbi:MAG: DUF4249 domain-containing protein [Bacteroidota bacterium]
MMKYRSYKYMLLPVFILTGYGCEKYVPYVDPPAFEQKLVITSFISPSDTVSYIYITSNQPAYGFHEQMEEPGDVTGSISDGTKEIQLDTTSSGLYFMNDQMPIISGKTYTLKVSDSKGLYAEATTTIPKQHEMMISVDTIIIVQEVPDYEPYIELRIFTEFTDIPDEKNYYSIAGRLTLFKTIDGSETLIHEGVVWFEEPYITDKDTDSDNKIKLETWISISYQYIFQNYDSAFLSIYLMNTEEAYYLYHTSIYENQYSDNPFSEVKPVYSNINGGFGIFTSYTIDSLVYRIK